MFLPSTAIIFFAMMMIISISAMPSSSIYQIEDGQDDSDRDEMQQRFKGPDGFSSWLYKRNSPLCDYRLQFRPLPLTSALCGYGLLDICFY
jgi:hypothetical protein